MDELLEFVERSWNILGSYLIMVNGLPNLEGMGLMTGLLPFRVVCSTVVIKEELP
jgi:hypothetical protein